MAHILLLLLLSLSQFICVVKLQNTDVSNDLSQYARIVGGDTNYAPIPYQISFQRLYRDQWRHFCSGSIISPDFFLTAAHCVNNQDIGMLSVLAGVTDLNSTYGSRHFVQGFVMHEKYVPLRACDIAVVKVTPPFVLNQMTIDAIDFTDPTPVDGGIPVVLTGWGSVKQNGSGPLPQNLQILTTYTLYNVDCMKYFAQLQSTEICVFRSYLKGACNGDSGGPLVDYGRKKLVGIVAFGSRPCANGSPDYFTRVSEFVGWILEKMALP